MKIGKTARRFISSALIILTSGALAFAQEYTVYYSGVNKGVVSVKRKNNNETVVEASMKTMKDHCLKLDKHICPFLPEGEELVIYRETAKIIVKGKTLIHIEKDGSWTKTVIGKNTEKTTYSDGYWSKTVVKGNITTVTSSDGRWSKRIIDGNAEIWLDSDGYWSKNVIDGNTELWTSAHGHWKKTVVDGNTETTTLSDGFWIKTVIDGNTETKTYPNGRWSKSIVDGNTEIWLDSDGRRNKRIVNKQGYNVYVTVEEEDQHEHSTNIMYVNN